MHKVQLLVSAMYSICYLKVIDVTHSFGIKKGLLLIMFIYFSLFRNIGTN